MTGKAWDMHKRAFQGLKRSFMHVSGFPSIFWQKTNCFSFFFQNQNIVGETWGMRFMAWNTRVNMSQVFPLHILMEKKQKLHIRVFLSKYDGGSSKARINVRFRIWKARLIMSQVFPHHVLNKKNQIIYKLFFFNQKMMM